MDQLYCSICSLGCSYDVLIFTETRLRKDIYNMELRLVDYNIYRKDKNDVTSKFSRDGGVFIGVHSKYQSSMLQPSIQTIVKVRFNSESVIFGALYVPPRFFPEIYIDHCSSVEEVFNSNQESKLL